MKDGELAEAFEAAYTKTFLVPPTDVCPKCGFQTVEITGGEYCMRCWELVVSRKERP